MTSLRSKHFVPWDPGSSTSLHCCSLLSICPRSHCLSWSNSSATSFSEASLISPACGNPKRESMDVVTTCKVHGVLVHAAPSISWEFPQGYWSVVVLCITLSSWPQLAGPVKAIWPKPESTSSLPWDSPGEAVLSPYNDWSCNYNVNVGPSLQLCFPPDGLESWRWPVFPSQQGKEELRDSRAWEEEHCYVWVPGPHLPRAQPHSHLWGCISPSRTLYCWVLCVCV